MSCLGCNQPIASHQLKQHLAQHSKDLAIQHNDKSHIIALDKQYQRGAKPQPRSIPTHTSLPSIPSGLSWSFNVLGTQAKPHPDVRIHHHMNLPTTSLLTNNGLSTQFPHIPGQNAESNEFPPLPNGRPTRIVVPIIRSSPPDMLEDHAWLARTIIPCMSINKPLQPREPRHIAGFDAFRFQFNAAKMRGLIDGKGQFPEQPDDAAPAE